MQTDFEYCVAIVLQDEGGLVNNPHDPGGTTNFGISQRAYPSLNIAALTKEQAAQIYYDDYWTPNNCGDVPLQLGLYFFTVCVMSGGMTATKLLQQLVGVTVDGAYGPHTSNAVHSFPAERHYEYLTLFIQHLMTLSDWAPFAKGWLNRVLRLASLAPPSQQP